MSKLKVTQRVVDKIDEAIKKARPCIAAKEQDKIEGEKHKVRERNKIYGYTIATISPILTREVIKKYGFLKLKLSRGIVFRIIRTQINLIRFKDCLIVDNKKGLDLE